MPVQPAQAINDVSDQQDNLHRPVRALDMEPDNLRPGVVERLIEGSALPVAEAPDGHISVRA
jgi:hypothetical protein